ncbi:MAG: TonB-dependent receptor [Desulfovermiculus sp.]|nr:TonB-dependent receptor [Desulfovermiculus sp.]
MKCGEWGIGGLLCAVCVVVLSWQSALAEDQSQKMDEVVVSATRSEIAAGDAPQNVSVLTSREIMDSPFDRVEDIVRQEAGIYNFRHFGLQTNGIVSPLNMRGVGQNRVLILVDGVPQNDNFNNAIAWVAWGHIPKEAIERIEIVRGPTSALYGSEGLGGVIHIITKNPGKERETSIRGEAGTADTYKGAGFYSQKFKNFGALLAGGYEESDGFYMTDNPQSYNTKRHRDVGKVMGKATYDFGPQTNLSLASLYYDHETGKGREFFYDELQLDQHWLNFSHQGELLELKSLVYLNRADKTAFQDKSPNFDYLLRKEEVPTDTWGADLQGSLTLSPWAKLTLGAAFKEISWDYDNIYTQSNQKEGAKGKQRFISPFSSLDFRFLDDSFLVSLGTRYDYIKTFDGANWNNAKSAGKAPFDNSFDSETEDSFSPKLGLTYHLSPNTTFRASGGKGFRAPSLCEMFKVHVRQGGQYYREANPNLKPEEIWSYDFGLEHFLTENLMAKATFYQAFAQDYIGDRLTAQVPISGGKTRNEYIKDNISEVDIYGTELEVQWYPRQDLSLFANYTYNISEVKEDENNPEWEGNYLPNDPRHKVHLGVNYTNPNLVDVNLLVNYYADIYLDEENTFKESDYTTVDLRISRKFMDRFTVYLNAENIFDEEYVIFRQASKEDTVAPGAVFMGGLKIDL